MTGYGIRPFEGTDEEYEAVVALQNLVQPNQADGQLVAQGWLMRTATTSDKFRFEEHNPMYGLNLGLGFRPQPADLDMEKVLI